MTEQIGRFDIKRELGRGAQSIVYLGEDSYLQREVAIKTMQIRAGQEAQKDLLLTEARMVSRLRDPGIVPVFEAGEQDGSPYLVFEYVEGESLAAVIEREAPMEAQRAATLMRGVASALRSAHGEGIVHRDLKPSNIIIDTHGNPRVMDFGIARRIDAHGDAGLLSGTPAYMAPEYIRDRTVSPGNDLYAAGLILIEMLTGCRVFGGTDVTAVLRSIVREPVSLPAEPVIDQSLAVIALRAAAHAPSERFQDAGELCEALDEYLKPPETVEASDSDEAGLSGTMAFLLRRIRLKKDFPALSESVRAINRLASDESENIDRLSAAILKDFSLTNKILRQVNSAHFRHVGGGSISTISRAVIVLGFDAIRNIAISILLFEHLQDKGNAQRLKDEFLRANLAGILARDLAGKLRMRNVEQAYICASFYNLGRLLSQFYFAEEAEAVRNLVAQKGITEDQAAQRVLGVSYEELGSGIARTWGFPDVIVSSMQRIPEGKVREPASAQQRLGALAACADEICDTLAHQPAGDRKPHIEHILDRYEKAVPIKARDFDQSIEQSIDELRDFASTVRISLASTRIGKQLRQYLGGDAPFEDTGVAAETQPRINGEARVTAATVRRASDVQAVLTAGIQDISNTLVSDFKLNELLRIILETMYRAIGFQHVLFCLRDGRSNAMNGRFGIGDEVQRLARNFSFPLSYAPDVFHAATARGADILISDIDDPKIASRVPEWYRSATTARTFVLLPLTNKGKPIGLIYGDSEEAGDIRISEKEMQLLRTLRNQALLAIKQAS